MDVGSISNSNNPKANDLHVECLDEIMEDEESGNEQETMSLQEELLGHFDEFGQFQYNLSRYTNEVIKRPHVDLKDLSEENFLDLIACKKQDQRFYHWLHFHPLFDGSDYSSDGYHKN